MAVHWMFSADKAPLGSQSFSNQGSWLASTFNLSAEGGAQLSTDIVDVGGLRNFRTYWGDSRIGLGVVASDVGRAAGAFEFGHAFWGAGNSIADRLLRDPAGQFVELTGTPATLTLGGSALVATVSASFNYGQLLFHHVSVEWDTMNVRVYIDNKLLLTGVRKSGEALTLGSLGGNTCYGAFAYGWLSDTRIGMLRIATATLGAPSYDDSASVTGAATRQAALASFDGDTSYVTYTEGSAQSTVFNAAGLSAIPSDAVIHAVKLTASAAGAGGVAAGELTLETAAGASDVGEVNMALSYSPTTVVLNADPATSAAFIASELAAGTIKFGVREG